MRVLEPASPFDPPPLLSTFFASPLKLFVRTLYRLLRLLRSRPASPSLPIRVVCISDTHCQTWPDIPDGDLLIHAGDLTNAGTPAELQKQIDWLNSLPHKHKVVVAGNHDTYLDPRSRLTLSTLDLTQGQPDWKDLHYLQHSSVTLSFPSHKGRKLKIYGAPQIPACGGPEHAFQYTRGKDAWSETIPGDTDVLVTHTPPKYHRDLPVALGCEHLLREVWRIQPKLHVFGHVHAGAGKEPVHWDEAQEALEKGCARSDGIVRNILDLKLWFYTFQVGWYGGLGLLWDRVWGGEEQVTWMVNAALMFNNTGKLGNEPQVVDI